MKYIISVITVVKDQTTDQIQVNYSAESPIPLKSSNMIMNMLSFRTLKVLSGPQKRHLHSFTFRRVKNIPQ